MSSSELSKGGPAPRTPTKLSRKPQASGGQGDPPATKRTPISSKKLTQKSVEEDNKVRPTQDASEGKAEGVPHLSKQEEQDQAKEHDAPKVQPNVSDKSMSTKEMPQKGEHLHNKPSLTGEKTLSVQEPTPIPDSDNEQEKSDNEKLVHDVDQGTRETYDDVSSQDAEDLDEEQPGKKTTKDLGDSNSALGESEYINVSDGAGESHEEDNRPDAEEAEEEAQDEQQDAEEESEEEQERKDTQAMHDKKQARSGKSSAKAKTITKEEEQNMSEPPLDESIEDSEADPQNEEHKLPGDEKVDLALLDGLEVNEEGFIRDRKGKVVGKLVEGDAEDLAGYLIGQNGEILDEDGDLVGRCELLDKDELRAHHHGSHDGDDNADDNADDNDLNLPSVEILEGLTCDSAGNILNEDGDTIGQIVEGEPRHLKGRQIQADGQIMDDKGRVIGRAEVHPDIPMAYRRQERDADPDLEDAASEGGDEEDAVDEAASEVEIQQSAEIGEDLPSIEALEGREVNSEGEVVDEEGNVLGELVEGNVKEVKGLSVNDQGQVIDGDGNVLGRAELADGAREVLAASSDATKKPDLRILEGLKVNKKGRVLDEEGDIIGELIDGDPHHCAGRSINDKGEVMSKDDVLGRVKVTPGEAADEATRQLLERLGELEADSKLPILEILEGLKVNKKGQILDEEGDQIGELVDGDAARCSGKKCNANGEVIDKNGKVIGRVKTVSRESDEAEEQSEATEVGHDEIVETPNEQESQDGVVAESPTEHSDSDLPPLSTLEGLQVNKSGKLVNDKGQVIGELTEGDAKKLSKSGSTCDAEGQFWDNKGHIVGRAKTVSLEDVEGEAVFAGLDGLIVNKEGYVEDDKGNVVGIVTDGDAKKLVGRAVDEDGDIIDKKGSVVGHAERYEEPEPEAEPKPEPIDLSFLAGKTVNKQGNVIGDEGVPVAKLAEGNIKECSGKKLDKKGRLWNDRGQTIGRVELIPEHEREARPEGPFAGLEGLRVIKDGQVADQNDNVVGTIVEGNAKRLVGLAVDEDGDVIDKYGNVKGHAEPVPEEEELEEVDLSPLDGKKLNKQGFVVNEDGIPIGRLVRGNVKELAGRRCDENGQIHGDTGKVVGKCELIPENERVTRSEGPFAGHEGLHVVKEGWVKDEDDNIVGRLVDGNSKRLIGLAVDEDGDIIDKYGNVKGHAEPYEEEEEVAEDLSSLAGCTVNKAGNIVNDSGTIIGHIAEGTIKNLIGKKVDGQGQIWDNSGKVVGRAELAQGEDTKADGPFAGFDFLTVVKDGTVVTASGDIVGRIADGDIKKLVGHHPDEDGDISDQNGNLIGRAERWEPEEKERRINPMSGLHVNKEGEVRDQNGDIIGRLTMGDLGHCAGLEIDDNGYVVDNDGNKVGEVTLLENIAEEEEEVEEEMTEEERRCRQEKELANKMANICQDTLERVQPICKQINESIEACERTPEKERDEKALVDKVAPLIEEAGRILEECNGALRALDPDGHIAAEAKARAKTREATPEEYRLADLLKELTGTVVKCIDDAKKRLENLPHAKRKLNPLWVLLSEPLFQILAAVGLLLTGVLGLVGQLLSALGLGGLVNGLLGGLGIKKLLGSLGLGDVLGGKGKGKGKGIVRNLPIVGGLLGKRSD